VLYHEENRRILQDVVTCIRLGVTIDEAGFTLDAHADRHLKPPPRPSASSPIIRTYSPARPRSRALPFRPWRAQVPVSARGDRARPHRAGDPCRPDLAGRRRQARRPRAGPSRTQVRHELTLIENLGYAPYFLTVHAIVQAARGFDPPILCQGRGSAANSAVCYLLGITAIDPLEKELLFERFVSLERREPPDIDVDFEHERREEVSSGSTRPMAGIARRSAPRSSAMARAAPCGRWARFWGFPRT
jgi:error-prone DNA polymerase